MRKFVLILLIVSFVCFVNQLPVFAELPIQADLKQENFQTQSFYEKYFNFYSDVCKEKRKRLKDKIDFNNIATSSVNRLYKSKKSLYLYIDDNTLKNIILVSPDGFIARTRISQVYEGIGLAKIGYSIYSKVFSEVKIINNIPKTKGLTIIPKVNDIAFRFKTTGFIRDAKIYLSADLSIKLKVYEDNKFLFENVYSVSNIRTCFKKGEKSIDFYNNGFKRAFESALNRTLKDLI